MYQNPFYRGIGIVELGRNYPIPPGLDVTLPKQEQSVPQSPQGTPRSEEGKSKVSPPIPKAPPGGSAGSKEEQELGQRGESEEREWSFEQSEEGKTIPDQLDRPPQGQATETDLLFWLAIGVIGYFMLKD